MLIANKIDDLLSAKPGAKVLLGGDIEISDLEPFETSAAMTLQPQRHCAAWWSPQRYGGARQAYHYVIVLKAAVDIIQERKLKACFAPDAFRTLGCKMSLRGAVTLVDVGQATETIVVTAYQCKHGALVGMSEQAVPLPYYASSEEKLASDVEEAIQAVTAGHENRILVHGFEAEGYETLPTKKLPYLPARFSGAKATSSRAEWKVPATLVMAGLVGYGSVLAKGAYDLSEEKKQFHQALAANAAAGAFNPSVLELMEQRKAFVQAPSGFPSLKLLAEQIASAGLRVRQLKYTVDGEGAANGKESVPVVSDNPFGYKTPDFPLEMVVLLPTEDVKTDGLLETAKPVLETLSKATGLTVRLKQSGYHSVTGGIELEIEGGHHG